MEIKLEEKEWNNLIICNDGTVKNKAGEVVDTHNGTISYVNGDRKRTSARLVRVVYELFTGEKLNKKDVIICKEKGRFDIYNLEKTTLKEIRSKKEYKLLQKKFTEEKAAEIREIYCKAEENPELKDKLGISMRSLARQYQCSLTTIQKIINKTY